LNGRLHRHLILRGVTVFGKFGHEVRRQRAVRGVLLLASGSLCMLGIAATPVGAKPLEHFSDNNQGSFVIDEFCGGMEVRIDFDYDFTLVARQTGPNRLPRYTVNQHGIETFTNLATGKSVTAFSDWVTQDVRVTDNGDGTLTVLYQIPGGARYFGPDGRVLLIDSRLSQLEVVLDHGGTPSDPSDDTFISEEVVREVAPHVDEDFCEAFRPATS
jgi:hypothetical protein